MVRVLARAAGLGRARVAAGARSASGMRYKEQPYLDPDPQIGDYPNLPHRFAEDRPQRGWWDRQNRRNFGEPIPEQDEILNMMAPTRYRAPGWRQIGKMWAGFVATIGGVYFLISQTRAERPYVRSFYPNGLKDELGGVPARTLADAVREASA
ncbi:hypothetical protein H4R18_001972 [Coemansia javaensis]|uniref:Uncharacterized protein n=1 Tax=Coemansia javaensis TaxID=2761396 RepID=A0A9W8LJU4_9FUNG|nr:hypothetical protein H4R18_001972 [Coemansia javaensis]